MGEGGRKGGCCVRVLFFLCAFLPQTRAACDGGVKAFRPSLRPVFPPSFSFLKPGSLWCVRSRPLWGCELPAGLRQYSMGCVSPAPLLDCSLPPRPRPLCAALPHRPPLPFPAWGSLRVEPRGIRSWSTWCFKNYYATSIFTLLWVFFKVFLPNWTVRYGDSFHLKPRFSFHGGECDYL